MRRFELRSAIHELAVSLHFVARATLFRTGR
jgi:hypothetical protein